MNAQQRQDHIRAVAQRGERALAEQYQREGLGAREAEDKARDVQSRSMNKTLDELERSGQLDRLQFDEG